MRDHVKKGSAAQEIVSHFLYKLSSQGSSARRLKDIEDAVDEGQFEYHDVLESAHVSGARMVRDLTDLLLADPRPNMGEALLSYLGPRNELASNPRARESTWRRSIARRLMACARLAQPGSSE